MLGILEHLPLLEAPRVETVPEAPVPVTTETASSIPPDDTSVSFAESVEEETVLHLNAMHVTCEDELEKEEERQIVRQASDGRAVTPQISVPSKVRQPFQPFPLGRRQYETMEKLLVTGSGMPWSDFDKVSPNNVLCYP